MKLKMVLHKSISDVMHPAIVVLLCVALVVSADPIAFAQAAQPTSAPAAGTAKIPNEQLDSLVAPIALYPDPVLSQLLVASTYPLELVQLSQWMQKNSKMPKEKMAEEVKKENWIRA